VSGFGKITLRADNDGRGFTLTKQGQRVNINLNYELARTQYRLLRESYQNYLDQGYQLSGQLLQMILSAERFSDEADSAPTDAEKVHLSDKCLNQTLWAAEELEFQKATQDIDRYRKGDVSIRVVDGKGRPLQANVTVSQISHDFLFGAEANPPQTETESDGYKTLIEAGVNYVLLNLHWFKTEPTLGNHVEQSWQPLSNIALLRNMGFTLGGEGLVCTEPGPSVWDTGLLNLSFDELKAKVYEHVNRLVSEYSGHIVRWVVFANVGLEQTYMGFSREQFMDLMRTGIAAVRDADPHAEVLIYHDDPDAWNSAHVRGGYEDMYTTEPYTFISRLGENGLDVNGTALAFNYGSIDEGDPWQYTIEYQFRDLALISRVLDWYQTLSEPIHITEFSVPGNYSSSVGYWHRRSWDEELQAEWVQKFYTIAFSKSLVKEITYYNAQDTGFQKSKLGLIDSNSAPRRSFYALKGLITGKWTTHLEMKTDINGETRFRGFAGNYNITVSANDLATNHTIHVTEQTSQSFTINLGKANAEHAITKAAEAVSKAKTEGRTILLDKAENLLRGAQKALLEENYGQAMLSAEEANRAADSAVTWLIIPTIMAFAGGLLSTIILLRKRAKKTRLLGAFV